MTRRIQSDIPENQVNFVVATMQADGAQVTRTRQADGRWTVTGVFPERNGGAAAIAVGAAEPAAMPARARAATTAQPASNRTVAIDILARTLWGEARGEPRFGKEAVAAVVLNRVKRGRPERFGANIEDVCRKPQQFSCWNSDDVNRQLLERVDVSDPAFRECLEIAERAVAGNLEDPTFNSDHYHTIDVSPDWSRGKLPVTTIGRHRFFNNIA